VPVDVQETKSQSTDPIALEASTGLALLSAEALSQLPDASQTRLTTLLPGYDNENDDVPYQGEGPPPDDLSSDAASYKLKGGDFLKATVLNLSDIPTLRSMYVALVYKLHETYTDFVHLPLGIDPASYFNATKALRRTTRTTGLSRFATMI
jgi:hypothetical protein